MSDAETPFGAADSNSFSLTIGDLAQRLDTLPRDALDDAIAAGVHTFWHFGRELDVEDLQQYLNRPHYASPVPELEIELSASQLTRLAERVDMAPTVITGEPGTSSGSARQLKPFRKFVSSHNELGEARHERRQGSVG